MDRILVAILLAVAALSGGLMAHEADAHPNPSGVFLQEDADHAGHVLLEVVRGANPDFIVIMHKEGTYNWENTLPNGTLAGHEQTGSFEWPHEAGPHFDRRNQPSALLRINVTGLPGVTNETVPYLNTELVLQIKDGADTLFNVTYMTEESKATSTSYLPHYEFVPGTDRVTALLEWSAISEIYIFVGSQTITRDLGTKLFRIHHNETVAGLEPSSDYTIWLRESGNTVVRDSFRTLPPVLNTTGDEAELRGDTPGYVDIDVIANDSFDPENVTVAINIVSNGTRGTAVPVNGTLVRYTATDPTMEGTDRFSYSVTAYNVTSATANVDVEISGSLPPTIADIPVQMTPEGEELVIPLSAVDNDTDASGLTYSVGGGAPDGLEAEGATLVWTPTEEQGPGTYTFNVTVSDGALSDSTEARIEVTEANQDPVFDDVTTEHTIDIGDGFMLDLNATDNDMPPQTVTYRITAQNSSENPAAINETSGELSWTADESGLRIITVQASDNHTTPGTADLDVSVRVRERPPVVSATVDATGRNPVFTITANSEDPISGRILDDTGIIIYNFTGITPASNGTSSVTTITAGFDPLLEPGNYTYQFARTADANYADSDVHSGTFTVQMRDPVTLNRDLVVPDILINAELHFPSAVTPAIMDPAGGNVTITRVSEPTLGILDISMLPQISYTPSQTGIDTLTYVVSDERGGTANATISIFINPEDNARPVLDHIYNVGGRVGADLNFTAVAADDENDPLTFGLANAPDGASITTGGDFSWRPESSQNGTHAVTFIVYDDRGGADWQHVTINILRENETNLPPVPQDIEATVVLGGGRGFQPDISDPENDGTEIVRVYDSSLGDVDRSFTSQGIIVYVAGVLGSDEVIYTVSDGRGGFANGTLSITVEEPANVRPLIEFVGDKSINAGDELTFTVDADDLDGLVTGFGLEGDTQGPSMSPQGIFSWTPTANDVGRHEFTILVFDDAGENSTVSITVTVRTRDFPNSPPVAPEVVIMTPQDVLSIIRPTLTDPDEGDPVRISEIGDTTKGRILTGFLRAGIIIYLPNPGETGAETILYTVSDSAGATDTATINVFISARGNTDPILGSIDFRNINAGDPLAFDLEAEDPDGDAISYQTVGAPDGIEISPQGAFSWTPAAADVGNHTFAVIAYDDRGGADSKTAVIRVLPAGTANQAPNAPDSTVTVTAGGSVVITPAISDPDGDRVTIDDAVASGTGVVIQSPDSINYIHVATTPTETVTYTVTDARGATSTGTITITIQ